MVLKENKQGINELDLTDIEQLSEILPIGYESIEQYDSENHEEGQADDLNDLLFKQQIEIDFEALHKHSEQISDTISNSIEPSIKESERFLLFLNQKFGLGLKFDNITILISEAMPSCKGYFASTNCSKQFINSKQKLNAIVLNTYYLKDTPYITIAHELAHYINNQNGVKDCSSNQYHNKHFKSQAEKLLLKVDVMKGRGYAVTTATDEFNQMIDEFKINPSAFHISQELHDGKQKQKSRLFKWVCDCGFIIRCGDRALKTTCQYCNSEFKCLEPNTSNGEID